MPAEQIRVERLHYQPEDVARRGGWDVQYRGRCGVVAHRLFVPDEVVDAIRGSQQDPDGPVGRLGLRIHEHLAEVEDAAARARVVVQRLAGAAALEPPAGPALAAGAPAVLRQVRT